MANITKRLARDTNYVKPKKTYQDTLSPNEIKNKLLEYKKVNNIFNIDINTHLRYFSIDKNTGKKQFRLGGFLTKINKNNNYIILSNGKFSWSVQINDAVFFEKLPFSELKKELEYKISQKYEIQLNQIREENIKLKSSLKEIKKHIKNK